MAVFSLPFNEQIDAACLLFKSTPGKKIAEIEKQSESFKEEEEAARFILCKYCKNKITTDKETMEVNGRHQHTYYNPEGIIYEIACFQEADGCIVFGKPTLEFTWFPGFSWRYSLCSKCRVHLGWQYQSTKEGSFFGLIIHKLVRP